jgi:hypothetical protein
MSLFLLLLLAADEVRPRWDREDCILVKGECYGLDVLQNCKLGPGMCFRFGIEEVDPPIAGVKATVRAPCDMDAKAWAAPRMKAIEQAYKGQQIAVTYALCDSLKPRIDVAQSD